MMKKSFLFSVLFIVFTTTLSSQVAWIEPEDATVDSTVTVYFDATEGDQGLLDFTGDVYTHTGVITLESNNNRDWKHVVADWGTANDTVLMERQEPNLYTLTFNIRDFYNIQEGETVLKLAFVFRNADGSETARSADGSDVIVPIAHEAGWDYSFFTNTTEGLKIHTSGGVMHFRPYNHAIKTSLQAEGHSADTSYAVVAQPDDAVFSVDTTATRITAHYNKQQIVVDKESLQVTYLNGTGDTLTTLESFLAAGPGEGGIMEFSIDTATAVYGGGSRALPFNLQGQQIDFYNQAHYGYANGTPNLNTSIPILATEGHFAWLFDNRWFASADIGAGSSGRLEYKANRGPLRFYLPAAESKSELSGTLANLTGHAPMPPLWGLGYIQSRYGYQSQDEAEEVVSEMRSSGFAMDALVLDLYWFGGTSHMGDFNWDTQNFPQPENMMENFSNKGIKTILITEPYFTLESDLYDEAAAQGHFAQNPEGNPYVLYGFWAGDASLFDITSPEAREWLWPYYQNLFDMGVSGLWTDLGEPETHPEDMQHEAGMAGDVHNIYNNLWAEMLHERTRANYPQKRLFNLTRSGYTGMQRYSTYPWSGDIQRSFSGLRAQIPVMLHMSMSGIGYMHSDLGGFTGGGQNAELYARWMQFGAFSPIMRAHGTGVPPEPIYYDTQTQNIVRQAIDMRYAFLPYNYTLAWKYSQNGVPPARPMNYYADDPGSILASVSDQYLWGKDLLVAPVLHEGVTARLVTLPQGQWARYATGEVFQGGTVIEAEAAIDQIPLFIREGGFIVQSHSNMVSTEDYESDSIRIRHLLPASSDTTTRQWYHDDGHTAQNITQNRYNLMQLTAARKQEEVTLTLEKTIANIESPKRQIEYIVYGLDAAPENIALNGNRVPLVSDKSVYNEQQTAAYWSAPFLYVHFQWKDTIAQLTLNGGNPSAVKVQNSLNTLAVQATPNPYRKNPLIEMQLPHTGLYKATLYRADGSLVAAHRFRRTQGSHSLRLCRIMPEAQRLPTGVYLLVLEGRQTRAQTRIVKQKR